MPADPKKHTRNHKRRFITMSPQALEDYEFIMRSVPQAWTLSAAIAWAGAIAREKIPDNPKKDCQ